MIYTIISLLSLFLACTLLSRPVSRQHRNNSMSCAFHVTHCWLMNMWQTVFVLHWIQVLFFLHWILFLPYLRPHLSNKAVCSHLYLTKKRCRLFHLNTLSNLSQINNHMNKFQSNSKLTLKNSSTFKIELLKPNMDPLLFWRCLQMLFFFYTLR